MKGNRRFSLLDRFVSGKAGGPVSDGEGFPRGVANLPSQDADMQVPLKGSALEQAYRDLMLENQILSETNAHLHERIARIESGLEESPAIKQLIRAQRNALAERSHRLREVQYENLNLKREHKKLMREKRKLAAEVDRYRRDIEPLLKQDEVRRREIEEMQAALREKSNELARLTDKYYQLEARTKPFSSASGGF